MKTELLGSFKKIFEEQKKQILERAALVPEAIQISPDELSDEVDVTSAEMESTMQIRLRNREALLLKKIDEALFKIHTGSFGDCESCGDDIGMKRLEARPTATLCISCKEDEERREFSYSDGRKHKSLGHSLRLLA